VHITFCLAARAEQSHRAVAPTLKFPGWKNTTTGHFSAGTGPANSHVKTYIDEAQLHLTAEKMVSRVYHSSYSRHSIFKLAKIICTELSCVSLLQV